MENKIDEIVEAYYQDIQERFKVNGIFEDLELEGETEQKLTDKIVDREYKIFKAGFLMANMSLK